MGCTNSVLLSEDAVRQCRRRRRLISGAVKSRTAFAAAFSGYSEVLKGAALAFIKFNEEAESNVDFSSSSPSSSSIAFESVTDARSSSSTTSTSSSSPKLPESRMLYTIEEEREEDLGISSDDEEDEGAAMERGGGSDLGEIFEGLGGEFEGAAESAGRMAGFLTDFGENIEGHIDSYSRVKSSMTWNKPSNESQDESLGDGEKETHAILLDKLLACENKLYHQVKKTELLKLEYHKKTDLLDKQKKSGANDEAIERTLAAVKYFYTRYTVEMQSKDAAISEIQHFCDEKFYPGLVALTEEMQRNWQIMFSCHERQLKIIEGLNKLNVVGFPKRTSKHFHQCTSKLYEVVKQWHSQLSKLMDHHKRYIETLSSWSKLNEDFLDQKSSKRESSSSQAPLLPLLSKWNERLKELPFEHARNAILDLSSALNTIQMLQVEELKQRKHYEDAKKDYFQKRQASIQNKVVSLEATEEDAKGPTKSIEAENKFTMLKKKLHHEREAYKRIREQVRDESFSNLRKHLPKVLRGMSFFSGHCIDMYAGLKPISSVHSNS